MNVLIGCETSAAVREQFELKGHNAWSCDLKNSAKFGNHYKGSVLDILDGMNGWKWDLLIAFPPCTHLANAGNAWRAEKKADGREQEGIYFFMAMINANIPKIAVENPAGIMSNVYRLPDQIIQPISLEIQAEKLPVYGLKIYLNLFTICKMICSLLKQQLNLNLSL